MRNEIDRQVEKRGNLLLQFVAEMSSVFLDVSNLE